MINTSFENIYTCGRDRKEQKWYSR